MKADEEKGWCLRRREGDMGVLAFLPTQPVHRAEAHSDLV